MNTITSLLEKIERAKDLDFGNIFESVIEMYKKVWLKGFLVILLIVVFGVVINLVFTLIGLVPKNNLFVDGFELESFFSFYSVTILYSIPQTILLTTITLAFVSAFYRMCRQFDLGETMSDDYFYFFKKEYFSKLLMLGIIHTAIAVLAQLMFLIPYIYAFIPLSYFAIVFANNPDLSEMEIVKASFALGNKKWLITFGTMFVSGILAMLGVLGCGIGVLFTMSIIYFPVFFIYKEVIGFQNNSEIEQIGVQDDSDY